MNEESAINGEVIDPFDVDGRLPGGGPIEHHHEGGGANLDVKLMNMKVYGLSTINLTESKVTRSENLTDFDLNLTFSFDALVINGSYSLKVGIGTLFVFIFVFNCFLLRTISSMVTILVNFRWSRPSSRGSYSSTIVMWLIVLHWWRPLILCLINSASFTALSTAFDTPLIMI